MKQIILSISFLGMSACSFAGSTYGGPALRVESAEQKIADGYNKTNEITAHGTMAGQDMSKFQMQEKREIRTDWFGNKTYIGAPKDLLNQMFFEK